MEQISQIISEFLILLGSTFLFFLPAFIGNLSPVLGKRIFKEPFKWRLDDGKKFFGKPLFGAHKSFGGLLAAMVGGAVGGVVAMTVLCLSNNNCLIADILAVVIWHGVLMGLGAILGDLAKSFFKRRIGVPAGQPWWFFDQVDFVFGAWLISLLWTSYEISWVYLIMALVFTPPMHLGLNLLAYKLNLKKVWW